ncbi:MAG: cyclic nucleotide-binding domain-containing protein [Cyanobacteria bacterium CRU_2_1]|nr:cyclic nucleotide-binding domain-containing protein [Cyanobacteria bacterium CRU_2_1]
MADVLLKELSNSDLDWMSTVGQRETIAPGTVLVKPCQDTESIYVLLDGTLSVTIPQKANTTDSGSSISTHVSEQEIVQLSRGEIVGETFLFNFCSMPALIKATGKSIVLSIPRQQLMSKLQQDIIFAAHFYRAIALILTERLRQILALSEQTEFRGTQPIKEALFIFAELRDSDIDWLIQTGQVEKVPPGKILAQAGRPIDALYLVLDGVLLASIPEEDYNPLTACFKCSQDSDKPLDEIEVERLSRGATGGIISFLDSRPFPMTLRALQETLVLSIPRQQLAAKLQQDLGFASRFYRIMAIQLSTYLQSAMVLLGCDQQTYQQDQAMDEDIEYGDELCLTSLTQVSQAAVRFNWMLKRLGVV